MTFTDEPITAPASGTQYVLESGPYRAVVASVGASLRSLSFEGRDLVVPFGHDQVRPAYRGATLAPWPNRVVDGRYTFAGDDYQLALTEPARQHALHGLSAWSSYAAIEHDAASVTLRATIEAQWGYPWRVVVETSFALTPAGLTQSVRAFNDSATAAPWGTGPHPYLVADEGPLDEWMLRLPAALVLETDPDRLMPTGLAPVERDAPRFDFRTARVIGAVEIDHAFTALDRDDHNMATVELVGAGGVGVAMTWDASCPWVQIHTADVSPALEGHRIGLAVEPMTCAPDAFNAPRYDYDAGLQTIEPGEWSTAASWRITARG